MCTRTFGCLEKFVDRYGGTDTGQGNGLAIPREQRSSGQLRSVHKLVWSGDCRAWIWRSIGCACNRRPQRSKTWDLRFDLFADVHLPQVQGLLNAASLSADGPVAPGSVAVISGSALAEFAGQAPGGAPPIALKAVSVSFDQPDSGISVAAPVFSVASDQVQVQVPWELAGLGSAYAKVRVMDRYGFFWKSEPLVVNLADVAPGIYTFETDDGEVASAAHADGSYVTAGAPARAGQTVTVYMTGTGPISTPQRSGRSTTSRLSTLHRPVVSVGGRDASVAYSGTIPGAVGITKIDFVVPTGASAGATEVTVSVDGSASNSVTIPVQ